MKSSAAAVFSASPIAPAIAVSTAVSIFIFDTMTDLEIAVAVLYVAVVLMAVSFSNRYQAAYVALICMALSVISYFMTSTGTQRAGLINLWLCLGAISATGYLVWRINAAEQSIQEARGQLTHLARINALGELAASIAHEVNQPLGAIALNGAAAGRWLRGAPPNIAEAQRSLDAIVGDANRASSIVAKVRALARASPGENRPFSMNDAIGEIMALMRRELETKRVALTLSLAPTEPWVRGDRVQMLQVILNLTINALESMASAAIDGRRLTISTSLDEASMLKVTVQDTGSGTPPSELTRIFDAFFTSKANGLGMGLSIARSIVEAHGGRIWAQAGEPRGFQVMFTAPIAPAQRTTP